MHTNLRPTSNFSPLQSKGNFIEKFSSLVGHNLSREQHKTLRKIIKGADKGGGDVILDRQVYLTEPDKILSDTEYYRPLHTDPTPTLAKSYQNLITSAYENGILNRK